MLGLIDVKSGMGDHMLMSKNESGKGIIKVNFILVGMSKS